MAQYARKTLHTTRANVRLERHQKLYQNFFLDFYPQFYISKVKLFHHKLRPIFKHQLRVAFYK